jgi:hypothetical protein
MIVGLDQHDFGMTLKNTERRRMDMEWAEAPPQRLVLIGRQFLVAKKDDQVVEQGTPKFSQQRIADDPRQVDAANNSPD